MQLVASVVNPGPAPVPAPRLPRAAAEAVAADRVTLRPVAFEPEFQSHGLFATRDSRAPLDESGRAVSYFDAEADAVDRTRYYGDLPSRFGSMDGVGLYRGLADLVTKSHNSPLSYNPSAYLYPWVDRRPGLQLDSIYSDKAEGSQHAGPGGLWIVADGDGPSSVVYSEAESKLYNCEHVVPQSWFDKQSPMRGDLHHLFTCDIDCNSLRGHSVYHEFMADGAESYPSCGLTDGDHHRFEPYGGKGAVARAVLYFLLRYPGQIGDEAGEYTEKDLALLTKWSREHPVTDYERHRNRAIQQAQGNRNPLVDFPELVDRIDFSLGLGRMR